MIHHTYHKFHRQGTAILIAIFLVAVFGAAAVGITKVVVTEVRSSRLSTEALTAFYAAEAGIEDALARYRFDHDIVVSNPEIINLSADPNIYYKLKVWRHSNNTDWQAMQKDAVREFDLTNLKGERIKIEWRRPLYGSQRKYETVMQWQLIDPTKSGDQQVLVEGSNGAASKDSRQPNFAQRSQELNIPPGSGKRKLKLHAYIVKSDLSSGESGGIVEYRLTSDSNRPIDTGFTTIESTGYLGNTQRKLQLVIDNSTGKAVSLFDYSLFIGTGKL